MWATLAGVRLSPGVPSAARAGAILAPGVPGALAVRLESGVCVGDESGVEGRPRGQRPGRGCLD